MKKVYLVVAAFFLLASVVSFLTKDRIDSMFYLLLTILFRIEALDTKE